MRIYVTNIVTSHNQGENSQTIKLYGRAENGDAETIEVFGFDDYFYAATDELREAQEALLERDDVKSVEVDGHESLRGESVGKVTVSDYYQKSEIAEILDETYESDVFVTNRLRVDVGLFTGVEAPDEQCHYTELEAVSAATHTDVRHRDRRPGRIPGTRREANHLYRGSRQLHRRVSRLHRHGWTVGSTSLSER
jgi:DNA polymerase elongation subunit (family B)